MRRASDIHTRTRVHTHLLVSLHLHKHTQAHTHTRTNDDAKRNAIIRKCRGVGVRAGERGTMVQHIGYTHLHNTHTYKYTEKCYYYPSM